MITGSAGLENGFMLQRPREGGINAPRSQVGEERGDGVEIFAVIGAEI